jgi:hypothetical protein
VRSCRKSMWANGARCAGAWSTLPSRSNPTRREIVSRDMSGVRRLWSTAGRVKRSHLSRSQGGPLRTQCLQYPEYILVKRFHWMRQSVTAMPNVVRALAGPTVQTPAGKSTARQWIRLRVSELGPRDRVNVEHVSFRGACHGTERPPDLGARRAPARPPDASGGAAYAHAP